MTEGSACEKCGSDGWAADDTETRRRFPDRSNRLFFGNYVSHGLWSIARLMTSEAGHRFALHGKYEHRGGSLQAVLRPGDAAVARSP